MTTTSRNLHRHLALAYVDQAAGTHRSTDKTNILLTGILHALLALDDRNVTISDIDRQVLVGPPEGGVE